MILDANYFEFLLALRPEIVVSGTAFRLRFRLAEPVLSLTAAGVGHEVMDTNEACRTPNILMAGRVQHCNALKKPAPAINPKRGLSIGF